MKKTTLTLAIALAGLAWPAGPARAAPPPPPAGAPEAGPAAGGHADHERMRRHARLSRWMGLVDALDLDEAEALRVRGVLSRFDERAAPLRQQMREHVDVLRRAARGDAAAQKGVDDSLTRLRELRGQMAALSDEMLQGVIQGLSSDRRAKAALYMHRSRGQMMMQMGERFRDRMRQDQPDRMDDRMRGGPGGGPGGGMGGGPGPRRGAGDGRPDLELVAGDDS